MTIASITAAGSGHLFRIPDDPTAYQANDFGDTWADTQYVAFMESQAGEWLATNDIPYAFFVRAKIGEHGDCYILIEDDNQAMRFKLANVGL